MEQQSQQRQSIFALKNVGTGEAWPLQVSAADWASNGYFVNAMNRW